MFSRLGLLYVLQARQAKRGNETPQEKRRREYAERMIFRICAATYIGAGIAVAVIWAAT